MASTCYLPPTAIPYNPIFNLDFQPSKPPASSDATALGCAARFNLSPVNILGLMHDRRFQGHPAAGQSLSSGCTADPSEAEMSDSDDDLPSVREIIARSKPTIDLTLDDDDDSTSDENAIEIESNLPTCSSRVPSSSLQKPLAHTADDHTTSSPAVTPARKKFPWKNVPPWSPLYRKLQLHSTTSLHNPTVDTLHAGSDSLGSILTELEPPPNEFRILAAELSEISPEIPETPAITLENISRGQDDHSNDGPEDYNGRTQTVNGGKHPRPFMFDVFTEDDDVLVSEGRLPAKRRRRAQSASSSVHPGEVRTPLVVNSRHDVADLKHSGVMSDDHEWQAQRIVGERQTSSGLEYEVSVQKTLWLPRATLDTKLVRKFRAEHRAATRVRTRWSSRLQKAGSSVR